MAQSAQLGTPSGAVETWHVGKIRACRARCGQHKAPVPNPGMQGPDEAVLGPIQGTDWSHAAHLAPRAKRLSTADPDGSPSLSQTALGRFHRCLGQRLQLFSDGLGTISPLMMRSSSQGVKFKPPPHLQFPSPPTLAECASSRNQQENV